MCRFVLIERKYSSDPPMPEECSLAHTCGADRKKYGVNYLFCGEWDENQVSDNVLSCNLMSRTALLIKNHSGYDKEVNFPGKALLA